MQTAPKTVVITGREVRQDKNKKNFAMLEISTPSTVFTQNAEGVMAAITQQPESLGGINGWEESNLPSMKGKPDFEWGLEVGQDVIGDIITRKVTTLAGKRVFIADATGAKAPKVAGPDKQDGKTGRFVDSMRVVVFGNTADAESFDIKVAKAFKRKGYLIVDRNKAQAEAIKETPLEPENESADASNKQASKSN